VWPPEFSKQSVASLMKSPQNELKMLLQRSEREGRREQQGEGLEGRRRSQDKRDSLPHTLAAKLVPRPLPHPQNVGAGFAGGGGGGVFATTSVSDPLTALAGLTKNMEGMARKLLGGKGTSSSPCMYIAMSS
jgi:hypothetical protein